MTTTATPKSTTTTPGTAPYDAPDDLAAAIADATETLRSARQHLLHAKAQPDALAAAYRQAILAGDADAMHALRQQRAAAADAVIIAQAHFHQAELSMARLEIASLDAQIAAEEAERAQAHAALGDVLAIGPKSAEMLERINRAQRTVDGHTHRTYHLRQDRTSALTRLDAAQRELDRLLLAASNAFA